MAAPGQHSSDIRGQDSAVRSPRHSDCHLGHLGCDLHRYTSHWNKHDRDECAARPQIGTLEARVSPGDVVASYLELCFA